MFSHDRVCYSSVVGLDLRKQVLGLQVRAVKLGTSELYLAEEDNMEIRRRQEDGAVLENATCPCSGFQTFASDHLI